MLAILDKFTSLNNVPVLSYVEKDKCKCFNNNHNIYISLHIDINSDIFMSIIKSIRNLGKNMCLHKFFQMHNKLETYYGNSDYDKKVKTHLLSCIGELFSAELKIANNMMMNNTISYENLWYMLIPNEYYCYDRFDDNMSIVFKFIDFEYVVVEKSEYARDEYIFILGHIFVHNKGVYRKAEISIKIGSFIFPLQYGENSTLRLYKVEQSDMNKQSTFHMKAREIISDRTYVHCETVNQKHCEDNICRSNEHRCILETDVYRHLIADDGLKKLWSHYFGIFLLDCVTTFDDMTMYEKLTIMNYFFCYDLVNKEWCIIHISNISNILLKQDASVIHDGDNKEIMKYMIQNKRNDIGLNFVIKTKNNESTKQSVETLLRGVDKPIYYVQDMDIIRNRLSCITNMAINCIHYYGKIWDMIIYFDSMSLESLNYGEASYLLDYLKNSKNTNIITYNTLNNINESDLLNGAMLVFNESPFEKNANKLSEDVLEIFNQYDINIQMLGVNIGFIADHVKIVHVDNIKNMVYYVSVYHSIRNLEYTKKSVEHAICKFAEQTKNVHHGLYA